MTTSCSAIGSQCMKRSPSFMNLAALSCLRRAESSRFSSMDMVLPSSLFQIVTVVIAGSLPSIARLNQAHRPCSHNSCKNQERQDAILSCHLDAFAVPILEHCARAVGPAQADSRPFV